MGLETFFFDSYALFEIIAGNKSYDRFAKDICIVTTKLNLMELFHGLLIKYDEGTANKYYNRFCQYCIELNDDVIKQAMLFKKTNKNLNLSYIDCVGYVLARSLGIKFLTGDRQFMNMNNVEFVK